MLKLLATVLLVVHSTELGAQAAPLATPRIAVTGLLSGDSLSRVAAIMVTRELRASSTPSLRVVPTEDVHVVLRVGRMGMGGAYYKLPMWELRDLGRVVRADRIIDVSARSSAEGIELSSIVFMSTDAALRDSSTRTLATVRGGDVIQASQRLATLLASDDRLFVR